MMPRQTIDGSITVPTDDPHMRVTFWGCSECEKWSVQDAWSGAWLAELRRRENDPDYTADEWGAVLGLDDRMVCPRCRCVHSDDETTWVDETVEYVATPTRQPGADT